MVVMAAADEAELMHMVATAASIDDRPCSFRYPRGEGVGVEMPERGEVLEIGKGRVMKEGNRVALLSFGSSLKHALQAAEDLDSQGLSTTVADARFAKPLDGDLVANLARNHDVLITIEEGAVGGFGSHVMQHLTDNGLLDNNNLRVRSMVMPDVFVDHEKPENMVANAGLDKVGIVKKVFEALGKETSAEDNGTLTA